MERDQLKTENATLRQYYQLMLTLIQQQQQNQKQQQMAAAWQPFLAAYTANQKVGAWSFGDILVVCYCTFVPF